MDGQEHKPDFGAALSEEASANTGFKAEEVKEELNDASPTNGLEAEAESAKQQLNFSEEKKLQQTPPTEPRPTEPLAEPRTPAPMQTGSGVEPATPSASDDDSAVNYNQFMLDTIMWTNKIRSTLYLVGGLLTIGLAYRLLFSSTTLVAGLCYIALAQMALNFCRQLISPSFQEKCTWYDSAWTYAAINYFGNALKAVAALNDRHLDGSNSTKTLRIGAGMWLVSLLGRYVSAFQLALGLWVFAFTLPKAYKLYQDRVDRITGKAYSTSREKFYSVDKRVRSVVIVLPIMVAGYVLSRVDLAVAVFLLMVYVRSMMQPKQVELVKKNLVPLTNTASKLGSRFGSYAKSQAMAYDCLPTPTPVKAKRT